MLLRSGRAFPGPQHHSSESCGLAGRLRLLKRRSHDEAKAATSRQVRRKSPSSPSSRQVRRKSPSSPSSPCKQLLSALRPPMDGSWVQLPPMQEGVFDQVDDSADDASIAELSVKVFPSLHPDDAASCWARFCNNAKACIKHYNRMYLDDFVFKPDHGFGLNLVGEPDGSGYYHLNFHARDKKGHSQLFFGEIMVCVAPQEEDVTCCLSVSPSDAGGKCIQTLEEMKKYVFPALGTADMDKEYCYGCPSSMLHPKGACYVAGHVADSRLYYMPPPQPEPQPEPVPEPQPN